MYPALNAWTFPAAMTPAEQLSATAATGFAGLELVVGREGPLTPETPSAAFAELAARARELNVRLVGLATGLFWEHNYGSPEPADRQRAWDLTLTLLDQAAAAQAATVLVVPAVVGKAGEATPRVSYGDALYRTLDALTKLRFEAEARQVTLALENVWNRFLLSPVETADLLDQINSPWVGMYFDVGNIVPFGYPQDWIATLAGRIVRVHAKDFDLRRPGSAGFCPLAEGSVNWPAVVEALQAVGYDGPLTYEGPGEPAEICQRLTKVLASDSQHDAARNEVHE